MVVLEQSAGYSRALPRAARDREHLGRRGLPASALRWAVLLAGLILAGVGLLLGLAVVWTQLARALPLAPLLHHPRALRAALLTGTGLILLGGGAVVTGRR